MNRDCSLVNAFCLVFAIFVSCILFDPNLSSASPVVSPSSKEPQTCDTVGRSRGTAAQLELSLSSEEASVSFKCSSSQNATLEPVLENKQAYKDENCKSAVALSTLFPDSDAQLTEQGDESNKKTYTFAVQKTARKQTKTLYYKCTLDAPDLVQLNVNSQPAAGKSVCKVKITVEKVEQTELPPESNDQQQPQSAPESTDEQQTDLVECSSTDSTKEAGVSAEAPLSFKCGTGMSLHPTNLTDVFDDQDGKCAAEVALQTLVDATLTKTDAEATHNEQPVYQLAVKTAPSEDTALCYKCVPSSSSDTKREIQSGGESSAKECLLKISVKGSASSAFSSTWGLPQGALVFFGAAQMMLNMS
ncbi:SRS domain-containing protein [Neospora caninum Liverpool]|uniref:SRS domain-containing protein n=1 Tax=Neospora caninum (strain Liverpool) TaxID=572307 RepID=F0VL89_NEOCL|nr:SRS domain-containing protein [Neospora caninum Liverpool]CBZ54841.1 SRS domain-containing protein [Neospora caninum Liverpool]CEL69560.1 TPA: SRS domain-containing protein [Neospora caninum Liverpool]|eukprot:XP_003884869.1 SRS domain-containing protein [Neospora caninum Liverpool]